MTDTFALGIDFGTQSARGVLVNIRTGEELGDRLYTYPHGVIDRELPGTDVALPPDFALQDPSDYRTALDTILHDTWRSAGVDPAAVVAIGVDFTACTILPVDENMVPLCEKEEWRDNPHSWVKLWKHHGAEAQAKHIGRVLTRRQEPILRLYGGEVLSEWYFPKLLELYQNAPEVYRGAYKIVHAMDWVNYLMTGTLATGASTSGFHCFWTKEFGWPDKELLEEIAPGFGGILDGKILTDVLPVTSQMGTLSAEMAEKSGLTPGIPVCCPMVDAHAGLPAVGVAEDGDMLISLGTSLCHILINSRCVPMDGICGVTDGCTYPSFYSYEAGQTAGGDIFEWFVKNLVDAKASAAAEKAGLSVFAWLTQRAEALRPGESGLLALDWWNGNRSPLASADLSGLLLGMTLNTRPEDIYRALVEATAFGTRSIVENFEKNGVSVGKMIACGGMSRKSPLLMQIFADVLGRPLEVADRTQAAACGVAMHAMVALGKDRGGYDTLEEAISALARPARRVYEPNMENHKIYTELFAMYSRLVDIFGRENPELMAKLKRMKEDE